MDNETLETNLTILDLERAKRLKENEDWKWAKDKLEKTIEFYLSLASMPDYKTATSLMNEVSTRKKAAGIVKAWIEEVEGSGEQQQFNSKQSKINNELITHFGE